MSELAEYRLQSRGGFGTINIQTSDRNGKVVGVSYVTDDDEVMLISQQGMILRTRAGDIRSIGRVEIDGLLLKARAWGEPIDAARHDLVVEPKGATYTALRVARTGDGAWWGERDRP